MEDKAKLAKAQMDRRLEKKKAKADHRAAASQRGSPTCQSDRASSHAQASTSSSGSDSVPSIPKRSLARRSSTTTAGSGSKRKVKISAAKTSAESEPPTRAQRRASTRSNRTSAWGKTDRDEEISGDGGVVSAKKASMQSSEQGFGTAVGSLFKVWLCHIYCTFPMLPDSIDCLLSNCS